MDRIVRCIISEKFAMLVLCRCVPVRRICETHTFRKPSVRDLQATKFTAAQVNQQRRLLEESEFSSRQSKAVVELVSFAVEPLATNDALAAVETRVDSLDKSVKWALGLSVVALLLQLISIFSPAQAVAAPLSDYLLSFLPK